MPAKYPQLDRPYITPLWQRAGGVELLPRAELEALIDQHQVDIDLLAELLDLALVRYQRLDHYGNKAAMKEEIREIIERRARPDR